MRIKWSSCEGINKAIFEEIPLTTDIGLLNCIHYDEKGRMLILPLIY